MTYQLHHGDCLEVMASMADNSVDAVVTDPPYGLSFMGKNWDHGVPGEEFWREALRVAKPGAHLLAFGGTRTFHRIAVAIEDAGWEIRDCVMWVYGSGFPKSLDVSKAIDRVAGEVDRLHRFTAWMRSTGLTAAQLNAATCTAMGSHYLTSGSQPAIPTPALWAKIRPLCSTVPQWVDALVDRIEAEREIVGKSARHGGGTMNGSSFQVPAKIPNITAPATDAARQWQGWGTALKPAWEPVIVARKPLEGTVAANVLKYGTGAINVDGCRINPGENVPGGGGGKRSARSSGILGEARPGNLTEAHTAGRWPANVIHDGGEEVVGLMGEAARFFYCAKASKRDRDEGCEGMTAIHRANGSKWTDQDYRVTSGERSHDRESGPRRNHHPTVKPTDLMRYLCRLVTPPGGIVLDPFMGSGSTGKAAMLEGFQFIGIEREAGYLAIAEARISHACPSPPQPASKPQPAQSGQLSLF